jgi:hypothetical protein
LGCFFRAIATAFSVFFFLLAAGVAMSAFLVFDGKPQACVDRSLQPAPQPDGRVLEDWLNALDRVRAGEEVRLSVSEDQATVIGQDYLDSKDVPVDDLRVYFCPDGTAEATGKVRAGILGLKSNVLVKGTLDVDGDQPRLIFDKVYVGEFPDFLARPAFELFVDEDDVRNIPLVDNITAIEYHDGAADVTLSP